MGFSLKLPDIPQDKVLSVLALFAFIGLFALTNHLLEQQPERDTQLIGMATMRGHGTLPPLHEAMNNDRDLTEMVGALSSRPPTDMFVARADVDRDVADILFRWSGSDLLPEESFGPFIDSRVAGFLQTIGAIPPETVPGTMIAADDAGRLKETWFRAFDHFRLRLLGQTLGKKVYAGGLEYDMATDSLGVPATLNERFVAALNTALQSSRNSGESIRNFLDFIDQTKGFGNLSEQEQDMIMAMEVRQQEDGAPPIPAPGSGAVSPPLSPQAAGTQFLPPVPPEGASSGP